MREISDEEMERRSNALDKAVRDKKVEKRGRPPKRSPGKYTMSPAAQAQREVAWVKALEGMPVGKGQGSNKKKIVDGYTHMTKLKELTNCDRCAAKTYCPNKSEVEGQTGEALTKCPMWYTYRKSIIDVTQNPLMYLAKKAGELDIAIAHQKMKDSADGVPISKEMLAATKLAMEAVKIAQKEERKSKGRGKGKMLDLKDVSETIDADFSIPGE